MARTQYLVTKLLKVFSTVSKSFGGSDTVGHIDKVRDGKASGWAFSPAAPARRVSLRLIVDGESFGQGLANYYRNDLHENGFGDGFCAFVFSLPEEKLDGRLHTVEVVNSETGHRLVSHTRVHRLDPVGGRRLGAQELLLDEAFYEKQAGIVASALDHYRTVGWRCGLNPHPLFDTTRYKRLQGLDASTDPLTHFEAKGRFEGASVHALFDPPVTASGHNRQEHPIFAYLERTSSRESDPSPFFSDRDYAERNQGVDEAGFLPLVHYVVHGWREGRRPHRDFDPKLFARLADLDVTVEPYGYFVDWLGSRSPARRASSPRVSIVVLNVDKAILTLQCLFFLERHSVGPDVEIIIVDNGSGNQDFALLCRYARGIEIVRIGANRGFGEGNNIGVEHARGEFVVFLNNDVFVSKGWLRALLDVVDANPTVGAVGAKLLYPDGRLQEAGATISTCGSVVQRGKHLDPRMPLFNKTESVDYCSAALLLVRAEAFRAVLGFDLRWDPAYYEDADLCLKLRTVGLDTVYAHRCEVCHLEHATASDPNISPTLGKIVATNRLKFVERWTQDRLPSFARDATVVGDLRPFVEQRGASLALYSPYALTPGGGERYLLTIAATYGRGRRCVLFTPDRYSRIRLLTLARELELDLDHVELRPLADAGLHDRFDIFVCMGNEVLPPIGGMGALNIFHCQFPFPMDASHHGPRWQNLESYDVVVVNSAFTANHYRRGLEQFGLEPKPLHIVPPPVAQMTRAGPARRSPTPIRILSVGRFAPGGHCKRQDAMIEAFRRLRMKLDVPVELHLAGAVGAELVAREHVADLVEAARDLPVVFHLDPSAEQIAGLYSAATLYWHLAGVGADIIATPERFEHFGIAIVEAMSAGVVPVALRGAGPSEIITDGLNGALIDDTLELVDRSVAILGDAKTREKTGAAAARRAADFTPDLFGVRFAEAVARLDGRSRPLLADAAQ